MKKINRFIPEKVLEHLNHSNPSNCEHLIVICDMIYRISLYHKDNKKYSNSFTDIPKQYFRNIIQDSTSLKLAFDYLKDNNIIECDNLFSKANGKALGYRISNEYFSKLVEVQITKKALTSRIIKNVNESKNAVSDKYKVYRDYFLNTFDIDFKSAETYITSSLNLSLCRRNSTEELIKCINKYNYQLISIAAIRDKELFFRHNKTNGRIDTNLTNLKSELKQFIVKKNLYGIDIVNSQPFFLNLILSSLNSSLCGRIYDEILLFAEWTGSGNFYENFLNEYNRKNNSNLNRNDIKEMMFCIFYSKNESYRKQKDVFKTIFPEIMRWIENQKQEKHNELAIRLQKMESNMCIDTICEELNKNNIKYYTIHDSWLVDVHHVEETKYIIEKTFRSKFDKNPKLDIKNIN